MCVTIAIISIDSTIVNGELGDVVRGALVLVLNFTSITDGLVQVL